MSNQILETQTPQVENKFIVKVATYKVETPESLPLEVLRFVVRGVYIELCQTLQLTPEIIEFFNVRGFNSSDVAEDLQLIAQLSHEELLIFIELLKQSYETDKSEFVQEQPEENFISKLLTRHYPYLYQVHTKDPNGPIVSFFSFSDDVMDKHVTVAWSSAATSRSDDPYDQIFGKMINMVKENKDAAAKKIETFGLNYGHSSILELVPVFIFINNIPLEWAYLLHHSIETYSSQELSTRYVPLDNLYIKPIEEVLDLSVIPEECAEDRDFIIQEWTALQELSIEYYEKWKKLVGNAYVKQFGNRVGDKKISDSTHTARLLDIARNWLILGIPTSVSVLSNLRTFINLLRIFRETGETELMELADQIEFALKVGDIAEGKNANAKIGPLIKYAQPQNILKRNVKDLGKYLREIPSFEAFLYESRIEPIDYNRDMNVILIDNTDEITLMVVQYIKVAFPSLDELNILKFLSVLNADQLAKIGSIIYKDHDRHHPMGAMGNLKSSKLLLVRAAISQMRDWNRQRATGKADVGYLLPVMHNTGPTDYDEIINQGFVTNLQLLETSGLQHLVEEWKADANNYYSRLKNYYHYLRQRFPDAHLDFLRKLIPLGHQTTFHMTTPPTQAMYTTDLRGTTGNDISNRWIAEQIRELTMSKNPFLRDVFAEQSEEGLDFNSAEQYAGRV